MRMSAPAAIGRRDVRGLALFVTGYTLVDLVPVVLSDTPAFMGLRMGDIADLFLVFVLAALYVELAQRANLWRSGRLKAAYAVALALMVQGHSIHLTANAIAGTSTRADAGWALIYFLDERWGHVELHLSFLIIAGIFIAWATPSPAGVAGAALSRIERMGMLFLALTYGVLLAGDAVEGQTVPLMLPAAIALFVWGFWPYLRGGRRRARPAVSVYRRFFAASFGVTALALLVYGLIFGGFPQPSALAGILG
jgi:hypothetical protein